MTNAHPFLKKIVFSLFVLMGCVFVFSCGLDVYYIIYPPYSSSYPSEGEALNRVFRFRTSDEQNKSMDIYTGTTVFYRIYNNLSELESDTSSVNSANSEFSENGLNRLKSLGYVELDSSHHLSPIISKADYNRSCEIRLFTEGSRQNPYEAGITVSGNLLRANGERVIPLRKGGKSFSYDVIKNNLTGDDIKISSNPTSPDTFYVNAYAVSVGMTSEVVNKYSEISYLGKILVTKPGI